MHGSIFESEGIAGGLCIINGEMLHPLNSENGKETARSTRERLMCPAAFDPELG